MLLVHIFDNANGESLSETSTRNAASPNSQQSSYTPSTQDAARQRERAERVRRARERRDGERQKRLEELLEQRKKAENYRLQQQEEKRRKLQEMRLRDEKHRRRVEERRQKMEQRDKERLETLLHKWEERETKSFHKSQRLQGYSFGRSTPRLQSGRVHNAAHAVSPAVNLSKACDGPGTVNHKSPQAVSSVAQQSSSPLNAPCSSSSDGSTISEVHHTKHSSHSNTRLAKSPVSQKTDLSHSADKVAPAVSQVVPREVKQPNILATTKSKTYTPITQDNIKSVSSVNGIKWSESLSNSDSSTAVLHDQLFVKKNDCLPVKNLASKGIDQPHMKQSILPSNLNMLMDRKASSITPISPRQELLSQIRAHQCQPSNGSPSIKSNSKGDKVKALSVHHNDVPYSILKEISEIEYQAKFAENRKQGGQKAGKEAEKLRKGQEDQRLQETMEKEKEVEQKCVDKELQVLDDKTNGVKGERLRGDTDENEMAEEVEAIKAETDLTVKSELGEVAKLAQDKMAKERNENVQDRGLDERMIRKKRLEMIMKRVKANDLKTQSSSTASNMPVGDATTSCSVVPSIMPKGLPRWSNGSANEGPKFKSPLLQQMVDKARLRALSRKLSEQLDVASDESTKEAQGETSEITLQTETLKEAGMSKIRGGTVTLRSGSTNRNGNFNNMNHIADAALEQIIQLDNKDGFTCSDLLNSNGTQVPADTFENNELAS